MTNMEKARQVAAQAWCDPETSGVVMDPRLAEAFARRLAVALDHLNHAADTAVWMSGSSDFSPEGQAGAGWAKACPGVYAAITYAKDPALAPPSRPETESAAPPAEPREVARPVPVTYTSNDGVQHTDFRPAPAPSSEERCRACLGAGHFNDSDIGKCQACGGTGKRGNK